MRRFNDAELTDPTGVYYVNTKCEVTKGGTYCPAMKDLIDDARIRVLTFYKQHTAIPTSHVVTVHAGKFKDRGIVLNYCPFCRAKLGQFKAKLNRGK